VNLILVNICLDNLPVQIGIVKLVKQIRHCMTCPMSSKRRSEYLSRSPAIDERFDRCDQRYVRKGLWAINTK